LRDHGSRSKYEHDEMGYNSRLDELQALVLRTKLPYLDTWNAARRRNAARYRELLADLDVTVPTETAPGQHVYHLFVIQIDDRDRVRQALSDRGVSTGIHYPIPIHRQVASHNVGRVAGHMPVTERITDHILSLPMYPELETRQLSFIATCIRNVTSMSPFAHTR
jgi:dTDP-4-amino-4,6-dideoxygalactose transaminase